MNGQHIIEKLVFIIPHAVFIQRLRDQYKLFEKLGGGIFKGVVFNRDLQSHNEHDQSIHAHPCSAVRLFQEYLALQLRTPVEYPDIIKTKKPPFKHIVSVRVLPVKPPGEIDQ
jgi:hypothetical protein